MALLLSSYAIGTVINLGALKTQVSFSPKQSLTYKRSKVVTGTQEIKAIANTSSVATKPLTKEDIIAYFASGCKPKEMWRYLEMRGADGGPFGMLCALPAFWVGFLYDEESLQTVLDMIDYWTHKEREMLRTQVPITGLKTMFRDGPLKHVAEDVLKLTKDGLERRGYNETGFLNAVTEVAGTVNVLFLGVTPAEKLLELYNGDWGQNIDPVFRELLY